MIDMQIWLKKEDQANEIVLFCESREDKEWFATLTAPDDFGSIKVMISIGDDPAPEDFAELARLAKQYS
jgi:hypothetical protein